ncbi:AmpG family muropeptide MFS transporter [Sphingomicrobium aestuariivivum]|uniref:AmpG family muropeptide MFS transporter n=1 Tax=Sphingomicrobium aestuariivivum TaxID=1582356 RepID=UPI001FD66F15|nr:MFS transporter [Sphingomicrobium aestuariivivum]MCJ8190421.1 MFS transporter [Sphingomicrobium aestuariivivum]
MADDSKTTKPGWGVLLRSLRQKKTLYMLLFGFAAGLPYSLVLGTLYAWLSEAKVDLETMGVFSLIGLAYAFKFLWSPALDRVDLPGLKRLGHRKQWIVTAQILIGVSLITLSLLDPKSQLGLFSLLAGIVAFSSATQDVVIDAWRVDVADEVATIDILSTIYQMGYRLAALAGGALALIIAARIGWPQTYALFGGMIFVIGIAGIRAPDAKRTTDMIEAAGAELDALRQPGQLKPRVRKTAFAAIGGLWAIALGMVLVFMVRSLNADAESRNQSVEWITQQGPLIILATIVVPGIIAAWLVHQQKHGRHVLTEPAPATTSGERAIDFGYRALVLPLTEIIGRLGSAAILVIALILTYRICDAIWGSFAYPFYLGELQYTNDEVAIASKFFGVGALLVGLAVGGALLTLIGRMAALTFGAVIAALTNLLYADLAVGGARMQAVADATGFTWLVTQLGGDERLSKLMITIAGENLAVGIAGAAFVAYLSSIVAKGYSAVQYALLSSLALLVGTLGRAPLGQLIEELGYYTVFLITTAIGGVAVVLCLLEWARQKRLGTADQNAPPPEVEFA